MKRGVELCRPITDDMRYDYLMREGTQWVRVQVKLAGRTRFGNAVINLRRTKKGSRAKENLFYSSDEIDAVIAFLPQISKFVILRKDVFAGVPEIWIRWDNQGHGCRNGKRAEDFIW